MSRPLENLLREYAPDDATEAQYVAEALALLERKGDQAFNRHNYDGGHFTSSNWIVNRDFTRILFIHHLKRNAWYQVGGHCEGQKDVPASALRELEEETGLTEKDVETVGEGLFDVHRNRAPARRDEPEHFEYDINFLRIADENTPLKIDPNESFELKWIAIEDAPKYSKEADLMRVLAKIKKIKAERGGSPTPQAGRPQDIRDDGPDFPVAER